MPSVFSVALGKELVRRAPKEIHLVNIKTLGDSGSAVDTGRHSTDAIRDPRGRLVQDAGQTEAAQARNVAVAVEEDAEAVAMFHVLDWLDPDVALRDGFAD